MTYVFSGIVSLITMGVAELMDMLGNGAINLLTIDIGSGKSFFDIVFDSMQDYYKVFCIISMCLLFINYGWQILVIMFSGTDAVDTPLGLTVKTITAGIGIYFAQSVIRIFEGFFNIFYLWFLNEDTSIDFSGFVDNMKGCVAGADGGSIATISVDSAMSVGGLLLVLIFTLLIAWQFLMYLMELAERYIVLGFLYYSSPLAFSVAGSKATGNIFASWVRMVGSQLLLMVFNVFFLKLFLISFSKYGTTIGTLESGAYSGYSRISLTIVWCLLMSGILYVGNRVDSYLGSLGLSVAQTGRGLGASIVSSGLAAARIVGGMSRATSKGVEFGKNRMEDYKSTHSIPQKDSHGAYTAGSVASVMHGESASKEISGVAAGRAIVNGTEGFSDAFRNKLDPNSAKVENGIASIDTISGKDGSKDTINMVPLSGNNASQLKLGEVQGKVVEFNGEKCFAVTSNGDRAFLTDNPAFNERMQKFGEQEHCTAQQLQFAGADGKPVDTGIWQTVRTDRSGNVVEAKQYAPSSVYRPDIAGASTTTTIGDMDYHVTDLTGNYTGKGTNKISPTMETEPMVGFSQSDMQSCLQSQFSNFNRSDGTSGIENVQASSGGIYTYTNAETHRNYAMAPAAKFDVAGIDSAATIMAAANGARYVQVEIPQGVNSGDVSQLFTQRAQSASGEAIYGAEKSIVKDISQYAPHDVFSKQSNDIGAEAKRRSHRRH